MQDSQAIRDAALDYIEGWYQADVSRMDRALSPHLAKRRIVSASEIWHVDKDWMIEATAAGKGEIDNPSQGKKGIIVLDQTEAMASVKIVSDQFVDYLHLARSGGRWRIVNALWDYREE